MITGTAEVGRTLCSVTSTVTRAAGVTSYTSRTTFRFSVSFQSVRRSQYSLDGQLTMPFASPVGKKYQNLDTKNTYTDLEKSKIFEYIFLFSLISKSPEVQSSPFSGEIKLKSSDNMILFAIMSCFQIHIIQ